LAIFFFPKKYKFFFSVKGWGECVVVGGVRGGG